LDFGLWTLSRITRAVPPVPQLTLSSSVRDLSGVGPERVAQLERLKIFMVEDLLLHRPHRYEDRRHFISIAELQLKEPATVRGKIVAQGLKIFKRGTRSVFELILDDGTARLHCRWWNLPFMEKYFRLGDEVMVFGKPNSIRPRTIDHPDTEVLEPGEDASIHLDRIVPIYPLTEGLPQRTLRSLVWRALQQCGEMFVEPLQVEADKLKVATIEGAEIGKPATLNLQPSIPLPTRANAVHMLHFPEELADASIARRRLAYDELFALQVELQKRRRALEQNAEALPCGGTNALMRPFLASIGFKLTDAQTRVLREIRQDMSGAVPMRRLLQGDVGSGKTAVAACSALMALESGFNVALMAPTEILAEQHFRNFTRWFEPLGVRVDLMTGARKTVESSQLRVEDRKGKSATGSQPSTSNLQLLLGTHALITPSFDMSRLGLVVIDEQHKFGVSQREQLVRKGCYPHLLVMTATPIPRTLGLTLYGDLDSSIIDELPANRGRIRTFVRSHEQLAKVHEFIRGKLREGRQAYVVYSRVDVADTETGIKAVTAEFARLQKEFAPQRIGLLHGRLNSREKESVMEDFRANKISVLLATSVIEVGVDVPNATVMVIENAEQFGLAQLHQLRGRVGRGTHESFCILVANMKTENAAQRMRVMEKTTDGFEIAEADLQLRGPGELLGGAQSGLPPFRFADLRGDRDLVELARDQAKEAAKARLQPSNPV
jgi:ATP-dependent DNA helicase RecG